MTGKQGKLVAALEELMPGSGIGETMAQITVAVEQSTWGDDEVAQAMVRHPAQANRLFHSFGLLEPTMDLMRTEFVYRSHCRELLDRVAAREDTRDATAAEIACVCSGASLDGPLTTAATALYMRMWARAFPDKTAVFDEHIASYEHVAGSQVDDLERTMRRKLRRPARVQQDKTCPGVHWGEPAPDCPFVTRKDVGHLVRPPAA